MRRLRTMGASWRAALAVATLYGLLLQPFLAGLAPQAAAAGDHGALCLPGAGEGGPERPSSDEPRRADCCLAACLGGFLPGPSQPASVPARLAAAPAYGPAAAWTVPIEDPSAAFQARGPPSR